MSRIVAYLQDEQERNISIIKQTIEDYIHGNPEITVFRFFLPSDQGIDEIKRACGKASLATGKPIDLIYPVMTREEDEDGYTRSNQSVSG
jgi:hypothetical protein